MTIRKEEGAAALSRLAELFPRTFVAAKHLPHRPLKVGIAADVRERCPDIDRRVLSAALAAYAHRGAYLRAIVAGADRIDLDGVAAGQVTAAEAEHTVAVLAGIRAQRVAERSAAAAPSKPAPTLISAPPSAAPPVAAAGKGLKDKPVLSLKLGQRR